MQGALGGAAVGASLLLTSGCTSGGKNASSGATSALVTETSVDGESDAYALNVSEESVFTADECSFVENNDDVVNLAARATLPYGSMVWATDASVAAALVPCATSVPLNNIALVNLADGQVKTVLERATAHTQGFDIYDVRANASGLIWTEADILNNKWRVFSAAIDKSLNIAGEPALVAENDGNKLAPQLLCSGNFAFWVEAKKASTTSTTAISTLMRAPFGAGPSEAACVTEFESSGLCSPTPTTKGVVFAQKAATKTNTYQLIHVSANSGEILDAATLPQTMKPTYVSFGDTGFSFAFEDIYNVGGGISNLGTYTAATGDKNGQWFRFAKTPFEPAAWSNGWFLVKSTGVVAAVDFANKRYFSIVPENVTQGYGEHLASTSSSGKFVTYSNTDYTPLGGQREAVCNVRVWEPK